MPRGDTSSNNAEKAAARQLAAARNIPYTEALRTVRAAASATEEDLAAAMLAALAAAGVPAELGETGPDAVDIVLDRSGWADGPLGEWDEVGVAWRAHAGWALVVSKPVEWSGDRATYVFDLPRDATLTAIAAEVAAEIAPRTIPAYLIWSAEHGAWWAPLRSGYVSDAAQAGRYTWTDADAVVTVANQAAPPDRPNELAVAAPETAGTPGPCPACPTCGHPAAALDDAAVAGTTWRCTGCGSDSVLVRGDQFGAALRPEIAEREWSTWARVRITQPYSAGAPEDRDGRDFQPGEELEMVQWGRAGRPVDRAKWWTSFDVDLALIVPASHVEVLEVLHDTPPTWAAAAMPADRVEELFGPDAAGWADRGVIVVVPSRYADRFEVRTTDGAELLGLVDRQPRTGEPARPEPWLGYRQVQYRAVIATDTFTPRSVPMPAGFIPASPARAADTERQRWQHLPGVTAPDTIRP
jgi:hypothetical protein